MVTWPRSGALDGTKPECRREMAPAREEDLSGQVTKTQSTASIVWKLG
jgi:hypothetical protein